MRKYLLKPKHLNIISNVFDKSWSPIRHFDTLKVLWWWNMHRCTDGTCCYISSKPREQPCHHPRWPGATQGDRRPPARGTSDYVVTFSHTFWLFSVQPNILAKEADNLYVGTIRGYPWISSIVFIWKKHPKACKVTIWLDLSTIRGHTWLATGHDFMLEDVFFIHYVPLWTYPPFVPLWTIRIRQFSLMFHYEHVSTLLSHCGRERGEAGELCFACCTQW